MQSQPDCKSNEGHMCMVHCAAKKMQRDPMSFLELEQRLKTLRCGDEDERAWCHGSSIVPSTAQVFQGGVLVAHGWTQTIHSVQISKQSTQSKEYRFRAWEQTRWKRVSAYKKPFIYCHAVHRNYSQWIYYRALHTLTTHWNTNWFAFHSKLAECKISNSTVFNVDAKYWIISNMHILIIDFTGSWNALCPWHTCQLRPQRVHAHIRCSLF